MATRTFPECWGHRGASAAFPENTIISFEAAIKDGAEGIESDIHTSKDGVLVMFHDPNLKRTTNSQGLINEKNWYGEDGMQHVRTIKEPHQPIPTFTDTLNLLMKEGNQHMKFNIDCKVNNDPDRLFSIMHECITTFSDWKTALAPRLILGLWHPCFIEPALKHVPYLSRAHIGLSPYIAKEFFWPHVEAFSLGFGALCSFEGQKFMAECKAANKKVFVWTVNREEEMMEAIRWNVDAILTDTTWVLLALRAKLQVDYDRASRLSRTFLWTTWHYYSAVQTQFWWLQRARLEAIGGPFVKVPLPLEVTT